MSKKKKIKLEIIGLSYSQTQTGAYALILGEMNKPVRLPIIIGTTEAQSIAIQLEGLSPARPLTHDLFLSFAKEFEVQVLEVNIIRLQEGIFYSEILLEGNGSKSRIDSRTSDAIAIALRFEAPIYCSKVIMDKAGIYLNKSEDGEDVIPPFSAEDADLNNLDEDFLITKASAEELEILMERALSEENYEVAGMIRDVINSKDKTKNKI